MTTLIAIGLWSFGMGLVVAGLFHRPPPKNELETFMLDRAKSIAAQHMFIGCPVKITNTSVWRLGGHEYSLTIERVDGEAA